jgi:hypothetical protein
MILLKYVFIIAIVAVAMIGVMVPSSFAENKIVIILPSAGDPECVNNDTCISPNPIYLEIGDTISFEKQTNVMMNFIGGTPEQGPDKDSPFGGQYNESGVFYYFDTLHPWNIGKIVVGITNPPEQTYEESKAISDNIKQEYEQKQKILELEGARNHIDVLENNIDDLFKNIRNLEFQIEKLTIQNNNLKKQLEQQLEQQLESPVNISENKPIPSWIKNNAEWWAQGLITEDQFVKGIEYLVKEKIIEVD